MDARSWDERYAATEQVWSVGPNRTVAEQVAGLAPGTALDVASGEGRNALWLAEQGWRVTAVDYSDVATGKARATAAERGVSAEFVTADVTTRRPERSYDQDQAVLQTPGQVAGALGGLRVEVAERILRAVEQDGTTRYAIDALVRATAP